MDKKRTKLCLPRQGGSMSHANKLKIIQKLLFCWNCAKLTVFIGGQCSRCKDCYTDLSHKDLKL